MTTAQQELRRLTDSMLNLPLFAMLRTTARRDGMTPELVVEHLRWMMAREEDGVIFASGPFVVDGEPPGAAGGLTLLRAKYASDARVIADDDPLVRAGVVVYELKKWLLMEGDLRVS